MQPILETYRYVTIEIPTTMYQHANYSINIIIAGAETKPVDPFDLTVRPEDRAPTRRDSADAKR